MKTDTILVNIYAAAFILFSLPAIFAADHFAHLLRFSLDLPGAKMEFIAAYGGLILGAGVYLALVAKTNPKTGIMAILCIMGMLFLGRLGGYFVDQGTTQVQNAFLVIELLTVLIMLSRLRSIA